MAEGGSLYPDESAIIALGEAFADCTLPKAHWTHAAHFAACLWLLHCRKDLDAARDMPDMIRRYNESKGGVNDDRAGYHETITQASIRAARAHLEIAPITLYLHEIHAALMAGPCGEKDWMFTYWSREVLMAPTARKTWVEPDLYPLSF